MSNISYGGGGGSGLPSITGLLPGGQLINGFSGAEWFDPRKHIIIYDDFCAGRNWSWIGWDADNNGGTIRTNADGDSGAPGYFQLETDNSTSAAPFLHMGEFGGYGPFILGGGRMYFHWIIRLTALSDATNTYTVQVGLGATQGSSQTDAVYMSYTHGTNSGNWVGNCVASSTASTANGDIAASTDWQVIGVEVNADASSVAFYVDGTEISNSPITTNIPTVNNIAPYAIIQKSAGTSERELYLDQFYLFQELTTQR